MSQADAVDVAALVCILILGVPHGALDSEIARTRLRPSVGRAWFLVFSAPYLGLAAAVLAAWRMAPEPTLGAFLAASVWHFGEEDAAWFGEAGRGRVSILAPLALGGATVALPVLLHPISTAHFLGIVSLMPLPRLPSWLVAASRLWCPVVACWLVSVAARRCWPVLGNAVLSFALFAILPPLPAFAAYFVCLHAPRHVASLISDGRALRVRSTRDAVFRAAPITALTFLIGAALWPLFPGAPVDRLLTLTLQGLSALTLPHMLLDVLASQPGTMRAALAGGTGGFCSAATLAAGVRL